MASSTPPPEAPIGAGSRAGRAVGIRRLVVFAAIGLAVAAAAPSAAIAATGSRPASSPAPTAPRHRVTKAPAYFSKILIANANSGLCMDSNGPATGPRMHQWNCNPANANQVYALYQFPNGAWEIYNVNYGECVDIWNRSTANGQQLQLWPCNGSVAQQFALYQHVGNYDLYQFVNVNSGKAVEVQNWSTQDGGVIDQWTLGSSQANQAWTFLPQ